MTPRKALRSAFVGWFSFMLLAASVSVSRAQSIALILFIRTAGETETGESILFTANSGAKIVTIGSNGLDFDVPFDLTSGDAMICDNPSMAHNPVVTFHKRSVFQLAFDQAENSTPEGTGQVGGAANNFAAMGSLLSMWPNQATYDSVAYRNLYAGVDLTLAGQNSQLNATFRLAAGDAPSKISWHYTRADYVYLATNGDLRVYGHDGGMLVVSAPHAWQSQAGVQVPVTISYTISPEYNIQLTVPFGSYDPTLPLLITFVPD